MKTLILLLILPVLSFGYEKCQISSCRYGECEQLSNGYRCHCAAGVKGEKCDRVLSQFDDPCLQNPCWNNGTCKSSGLDSWFCICASGFSGATCRNIKIQPCDSDPCQNGGFCQELGQEKFCFCGNDYTGKRCEKLLPLCSRKINCMNNGICSEYGDFCNCPKNYNGVRCEQLTNRESYTVKLKNKGWFTSIVTLSYTFGNIRKHQKATILGLGGSRSFDYEAGSSDVHLQVDAVAGRSKFYDVYPGYNPGVKCYHVWGAVTDPKGTPMNCEEY